MAQMGEIRKFYCILVGKVWEVGRLRTLRGMLCKVSVLNLFKISLVVLKRRVGITRAYLKYVTFALLRQTSQRILHIL
jgi:hypothetical protein